MQKNKNFVLFLVLSMLILFGGMELQKWLFPPLPKVQPKPPETPAVKQWESLPRDVRQQVLAQLSAITAPAWVGLADALPVVAQVALAVPEAELIASPRVELKEKVAAQPVAPESVKPIVLGDEQPGRDAKFNLHVVLDPRGGGVRRVVLNRFQQADAQGRPVWDPKDKKIPQPLELVPWDPFTGQASNLLYHYREPEKKDESPVETLGKRVWKVLSVHNNTEANQHQVSFETTIYDVTLTKTYTLTPGDYHIGLTVKLQLDDRAKERKFRYQLASAHGLPVEGDWYTSVLRNAVIGRGDGKGNLRRTMQDLREISRKWGGDVVEQKTGEKPEYIFWAGVAVQYFASLVVVDNEQEGQQDRNFLARARATLESAVLKGKIKSVNIQDNTFELIDADLKATRKIHLTSRTDLQTELKDGQEVTIHYTENEKDQIEAIQILLTARVNKIFIDDITVRVTTDAITLEPGKPVVHKYLLYNGPVKVRLLSHLEGKEAVDPALVVRYEDTLRLDKLTDAPFPNWFSENVLEGIGVTFLLIKCTNIMHEVLWFLHKYIMPWSWGLCIILLTVLVRGMMFPVSRKQAMTSIRMQELAPEIKKLQEKYKDNRQALGLAQMELYRKYGINPLGSCWLIFLQMPIFLGLYYALQESIHFRLAPFAYIENLAAPDMLLDWSKWPVWAGLINNPSMREGFLNFLYLGPFFNLLPVIAVALMIFQQKMMMPPPTDEQSAMQQKMMKYMMIFMGLMFYKVAAGLCVYFIASSLWSFTERKLLPKRKPLADGTPAAEQKPSLMGKLLQRLEAVRKDRQETGIVTSPTSASPAVTTAAPEPRGSGKRKHGRQKRKPGRDKAGVSGPSAGGGPPEGAKAKVRTWWEGLREWWTELLKKAEKR